jgi:pSer/pThr/pTyr-binding forkhead associated (FHA) protein
LPGVLSELARLDDAHILTLSEGEAAIGAIRNLEAISSGDQVKLLKKLPWREAPEELEQPAEAPAPIEIEALAAEPEATATHIVYRGVAIPVDANGLLVGREDQEGRRTIVLNGDHGGVSRSHCEFIRRDGELRLKDLSQFGTYVNEKRIAGDLAIQPADVIRIGTPGEELQAILLESDDGA